MSKFLASTLAVLLCCSVLVGCNAGDIAARSSSLPASAAGDTQPEEQPGPLTLEDVQQMNGGSIRYSTNENGNITFLAGKFYNGKIESGEDVLRAVDSMSTLIGADENTAFKKGPAVVDDNGYTYYTLQQWHGESEVIGSIVKVVVDPNGEAAAISSSITPGVDAGLELIIPQEEAVEAVRIHLAQTEPQVSYVFYPEQVDKAAISYAEDMEADSSKTYNVYVVYTDNPSASVEETDFLYMAHYVSSEGAYLYGTPVFRMGSEAVEAGGESQSFFQGKTARTYTGSITLHDGSIQQISVPVLLDEAEGTYYLADDQRKIAVADYWEFIHNGGSTQFSSNTENEGWDNTELIAYANYIKIYDFYHEIGWDSTDGRGTPILLLSGICDEERNPENNASYLGKYFGWSCFGFSSVSDYSECMDVMAHEYTHGVTTSMMTTILYQNEPGAINESMSDILGNIAEMLLEATDDTTWQIAEQSGEVLRCMSDPNAYGQPAYIGDIYYAPEPASSDESNDWGGVHVNNSILCTIPPILHEAGMTLEEQRVLWTTAICALTPQSGYRDFYEIFSNAVKLTGLSQYQGLINETFEDLGIIGEHAGQMGVMKEGCGRVTFEDVPTLGRYPAMQVMVFAGDGSEAAVCVTWADKNNIISSQLFEGEYYIRIKALNQETGEKERFYYTPSGWSQDAEAEIAVSIPTGEEIVLMDFAS